MVPDFVQADDRVQLSGELSVPNRFVEPIGVLDVHGSEIASASVSIAMIDGKEHVLGVDFDRALSATELQEVDWLALAHNALLFRAFRETAVRVLGAPVPPEDVASLQQSSAWRDLTQAIPPRTKPSKRTYNRMRHEDYERVAEAWREGGPEEVRRRFFVSLRQASRYVAKAREMGLL